ncbi:MAG: hypothetical protein LC792_16960 [Actinobacteria bacterium]|nr:hypothetical protein [Actinomycetota bacterium]
MSSDPLGDLRDDGVSKDPDSVNTSVQPAGRPINHSTHVGFNAPPAPCVTVSFNGLALSFILFELLLFQSLAEGVGHRFLLAIVSRLARTGPTRPAPPPWFVP